MNNPLLEIKNLESWYGKVKILNGVDIHIAEGEIVSLIGPNGAGKSTVLKNIFGLIEKRHGEILFNGDGKHINLLNKTSQQIVKTGISYVPQGRSVFPSLTVQENLDMGAYIREDKKSEIMHDLNYAYEKFPILRQRKNQKAGLLSGGEQQMLAIARALMLHPKLMLLDEPSLGLSPKTKFAIFEKIKEINKSGVTILIVEQNARMSLEMSDRAYVLELGKNKLEGNAKDLTKDERVQHLYLGGAV
ncbi:TPA: ABC transporter ATP-binding protein [Candidatus Woesearchaeota archaeon]|nr:ABC transporter ATP-binding protein [Candidatus Woesearchaeota archaeon]